MRQAACLETAKLRLVPASQCAAMNAAKSLAYSQSAKGKGVALVLGLLFCCGQEELLMVFLNALK